MARSFPKSLKDKSSLNEGDPAILLGVLSAVESDAQVTQRRLSSELGIALGLANLYLKRCVRKGWIKVGQVPLRRYAYYLTPQGFSEKARLTGEYLSWNLEFFRRARQQSTELFLQARADGLMRFALIGAGDLAEVAVLSAVDADVEIIGIIHGAASSPRCAGKPVFSSVGELLASQDSEGVQALMVTRTSEPDTLIQVREIAAALGVPLTAKHVLMPRVLNLSWTVPAETEALN
jgi:hypothetical protein